jgi:hypothetical protein
VRRRSFAKPSSKGRKARERYGEGCIGGESIGHAVGGEKRKCDRRETRRRRVQTREQEKEQIRKNRSRTQNREQREERAASGDDNRMEREEGTYRCRN